MTTDAALGANSGEFACVFITREGLINRKGIINPFRIYSQYQWDIAGTQLINDQQDQITVRYGKYNKWPLACVRCHIVYNVVSLIV